MDDDELLRRLAATARQEEDEERERLDARWDARAAGTLPAAEAEALRAGSVDSTEGKMAWEAFTPLGDDFRSRMVAAIRQRVPAAAPAVAPWRRRRLWLAGAAAAAAIAATVLVLVLPGGEALPGYTARLTGGTREMRSGTEPPAAPRGPQVFVAGNSFAVVLTPEREVAGRLAARAFLARDGGVSPWPVPVEVSEHGAVRIAGQVGKEIRLPAGEADLLVAIGRPGALPAGGELRGREGAGCRPRGREVIVCRLPVVFRQEP